ncbi:MAG: carbohydrate-binding family 9-like protein [Capsulimonadaceae bacterium]|nr:carbohydrate-binding family 9-like protein [Capsulimonadaceae bacterium]
MLRTSPLFLIVALVIAGMHQTAFADVTLPVHIPAIRPVLEVPNTTLTPRVDASADDPAWASAAVVDSLGLALDSPAPEVALPTNVKLLWDADYLYVRFEVGGKLLPYGNIHGHDADLASEDCVGILIDPRGVGAHWLEILATPSNDIRDEAFWVTGTAQSDDVFRLVDGVIAHQLKREPGWNVDGLRSLAVATPTGWRLDMAIPATTILGTLEMTQFTPSTSVRANFLRYDYSPTAQGLMRVALDWAPVPAGAEDLSPQGMGFLRLETTTPQAK